MAKTTQAFPIIFRIKSKLRSKLTKLYSLAPVYFSNFIQKLSSTGSTCSCYPDLFLFLEDVKLVPASEPLPLLQTLLPDTSLTLHQAGLSSSISPVGGLPGHPVYSRSPPSDPSWFLLISLVALTIIWNYRSMSVCLLIACLFPVRLVSMMGHGLLCLAYCHTLAPKMVLSIW